MLQEKWAKNLLVKHWKLGWMILKTMNILIHMQLLLADGNGGLIAV